MKRQRFTRPIEISDTLFKWLTQLPNVLVSMISSFLPVYDYFQFRQSSHQMHKICSLSSSAPWSFGWRAIHPWKLSEKKVLPRLPQSLMRLALKRLKINTPVDHFSDVCTSMRSLTWLFIGNSRKIENSNFSCVKLLINLQYLGVECQKCIIDELPPSTVSFYLKGYMKQFPIADALKHLEIQNLKIQVKDQVKDIVQYSLLQKLTLRGTSLSYNDMNFLALHLQHLTEFSCSMSCENDHKIIISEIDRQFGLPFKSLREMDVKTDAIDILTMLTGVSTLSTLRLRYTSHNVINHIKLFTRLQHLSLVPLNSKDTVFPELPLSLQSLTIEKNNFFNFQKLEKCTLLSNLNITACIENIKYVFPCLPSVETLSVVTHFTDDTSFSFPLLSCNFPNITELHIRDQYFGHPFTIMDSDVNGICLLPRLSILFLGECSLTIFQLQLLLHVTTLSRINFSNLVYFDLELLVAFATNFDYNTNDEEPIMITTKLISEWLSQYKKMSFNEKMIMVP